MLLTDKSLSFFREFRPRKVWKTFWGLEMARYNCAKFFHEFPSKLRFSNGFGRRGRSRQSPLGTLLPTSPSIGGGLGVVRNAFPFKT
jgi:hypothetical protein